jgi:Ca2+-binding EF-hand superfamily protein
MGKSKKGKGKSAGGGRSGGSRKGQRKGKSGKGGAPGRTDDDRLRQIFQKVDSDGSGQIEAGELGEALENGAWEPFNPGTVALMVGMFDRNGDGTISFPEFKKLWKYMEEWTTTFRRYDADGSGRISAKELHTALSSFGYRLGRSCIQTLVRRFDRTKEDSLAFDDFIEACVVLDTVTGVFKDRDTQRRGSVNYAFEDFVADAVSLVFRLQYPNQDQDTDE